MGDQGMSANGRGSMSDTYSRSVEVCRRIVSAIGPGPDVITSRPWQSGLSLSSEEERRKLY